MNTFLTTTGLSLLLILIPPGSSPAQEFDYSKDRVLHVVGTAHLDTQWRWTIQTTINQYIPNTLRGNFPLFEKYPDYTFSFEGAFRYMLAKEYYPEDYARLKDYIAKGRWAVCGSSVDACDVNVPSPESLIRQVLYGNGFFQREFGKTSRDIFLPDCFGFGYALPSVAAHCGLMGFSSQKLTWGSSVGIPFDVGAWEGVDGSRVVAELNPDEYVSRIRSDLSADKRWSDTIEKQGRISGLSVGYKYFGVGDTGGAPDDESVAWLEKSIRGSGPLKVVSAPADRLCRELASLPMERLPLWKGELLMTTHGTGCYTSQAAMKRWNRKNELLADAAERASVAADWLGAAPYPGDKLREAWVRFLWHQFHDDLTGTSIPEAYTFSWNDEVIALNQFSSVLENALGAASRALDTRVKGHPLVVFNPLSMEREDVVEAEVVFEKNAPKHVRVFDPSGNEAPSQVSGVRGNSIRVLFLARAPSVGFAVFDVRPSDSPCSLSTGLRVTDSALENGRYLVRLDSDGNVAGITDKKEGREVLSGPARLALFNDESPVWPAWEITYGTVTAQPTDYVRGPATVRVEESGPARAALEVVRIAGNSKITQYIRLSAGESGNRVEFDTDIDWRTKGTLLKAVFPLAVSNPKATYDLGLGIIQRGDNTANLYEVPAQQWADITAPDASYGAAVLNDCKYGWDKPDDSTLRLTLLHTPKPGSFQDQALLDIGRHRMTYAITAHKLCWRAGKVVWEAARLNQPLLAFQTSRHDGAFGKSFSTLRVSAPQVIVRACKKAEESGETVVRLVETFGRDCNGVTVTFAAPVVSAREINGAEEPVGEAAVRDGALVTDLKAFRPRAFAVRLARPNIKYEPPRCRTVDIPYDLDGISMDNDRSDGDFDGAGRTLPGELLPAMLESEGVTFRLGSGKPGVRNALSCRGQTIKLPRDGSNRLYLLAAAVGGDTKGVFTVDGRHFEVSVQDFTGFVGQWDSRIINGELMNGEFQLAPAFIKRDRIAWVGTHRHSKSDGNEAYVFCYLYRYGIEIPPNARTLTLPNNERIHVFALTAARNFNDETRPAYLLYDTASSTSVSLISESRGFFLDRAAVALKANPENAEIRYTLDGGDPGPSSPLYRGPFTLTETATLKARAFSPDMRDSQLFMYPFTKITPRAADTPGPLVPGLQFAFYEGDWNRLPDFAALKPDRTGAVDTFAFPQGVGGDHFALLYTGWIDVPTEGVYTFFTASDDGSRLSIGDRLVVDNDGLHGPDEIRGTIALRAGKHPITVSYFEKGGGESLTVQYEGPGIAKRNIGPEVLWRRE
jgi:alpha-mannosidase